MSKITARSGSLDIRSSLSRVRSSGKALAFAAFEDTDDGGQDGDDDNDRDHIVDVFSNVRNRAAKHVTAQNGGGDPEDAAKDVKEQVTSVRHFCRASHRRTKGTNDWHESR